MGVHVLGMRELILDLEHLDEQAGRVFPKIVSKGALNIKTDWREGWTVAGRPGPGHIPHLIKAVGYDTDHSGSGWSANIGPRADALQAGLAEYITYGTVNSPPHDAGKHALDAEEPGFVRAVAEAAVDLLEG